MAVGYHHCVSTDNPDVYGDAIKGDIILERTKRISGSPGRDDGLIELALVGHPHTYRVRVDLGGGPPRLVELHLLSEDDTADIGPATVRQIPIRRLAKAAARFIGVTEHGMTLAGDEHDPTELLRPDIEPPNRRKLDDAHYRQVAKLLMWAREIGESPREYVAAQFAPTSLPTVDRWLAEAKKRGFLRRDWATTSDPTD